LLSDFLFFEQNYFSFGFLNDLQKSLQNPITDSVRQSPLVDEEKLHSKLDKFNKMLQDHLNSIEQPVPVITNNG
jgi:hypothetical protein